MVCGSFFCAGCLLKQARGNGLPSPAILSFGAPSFLSCRLGSRRNRRGRWVPLLPLGLLLPPMLLLTKHSLQVLLVPTQAVLLLPGLCPALIKSASRSASRGLMCSGFQCLPGPLSRTCTTSLWLHSTLPERIGQPAAR